jgi:arsenate reductase (glutaredoxin)
MSDIQLFGISNCDTVKKALAWFASQGVGVQWHDFKKMGVPEPQLELWLRKVGWEKLLNRQGTTWRKLDELERNQVVDATSAKAVMCKAPSTIRRPVVQWPSGMVTVGFEMTIFAQQLKLQSNP